LGYVLAIADSGCDPFRRTNEMLCPFVSLLACEQRQAARIESDQLSAEEMIGDVPSWAFDVYSREGRAALARFLQTDVPAARWIRRNVSPARRVSFLGHIVFRVEGGLVVNRMRWPLADELRRQADVERSGPEHPDAAEILALMRDDIPRLNEARAAGMGAARN
jgi:hypothetical protein